MKKLMIIIDNGHGIETKGKSSPDKRLMEWKWTREFALLLHDKLTSLGIDSTLLVTEEKDVSLGNRVLRANTLANKYKDTHDSILISIHNNAAKSDGKWHDASGFTSWIYTNGSSKSKKLGSLYAIEADLMDLTGNRYIPSTGYFTANFYILNNSSMPAVLIENGFMDNKEEVDFLLSENGKKKILEYHINSILNYMKYYNYIR